MSAFLTRIGGRTFGMVASHAQGDPDVAYGFDPNGDIIMADTHAQCVMTTNPITGRTIVREVVYNEQVTAGRCLALMLGHYRN